MYSSNLNTNMNITKYIFVLDVFCQQLGKTDVDMSVGRFLWILWAQGWGHFEIKFCTGYKLPTFWEYNSVWIIHQRVSVRPLGVGFRNILCLIFILDISCQHLGNTCQLDGIGYILPTIGGYILSVGGFLPQGPTVRGPIVHPEKVDSWAPDSWAPDSWAQDSWAWGPGQLGPGEMLEPNCQDWIKNVSL